MKPYNFKHLTVNREDFQFIGKSKTTKFPFWFGNEDSDHIRSIIVSYEDSILQRHFEPTSQQRRPSRRPKEFIGRVSRYFLCYDLPLRKSLISIDEVNVFKLLLLPKGMYLPLKYTVFCRTSWDVNDGLPSRIEVLDDQKIQKDLLGPCSYLYAEPKWNTNYYVPRFPAQSTNMNNINSVVEFEYRVSNEEVSVGFAGQQNFTTCLQNGFENLARAATAATSASTEKNISKPGFKWKIDEDEEDDEEEDIFNDEDEVYELSGLHFGGEDLLNSEEEEPKRRNKWDSENDVTSFSELIHEDEEEEEGDEEVGLQDIDQVDDFFNGDDLINSSSDDEDDEDNDDDESDDEGFIEDSDDEEEEDEFDGPDNSLLKSSSDEEDDVIFVERIDVVDDEEEDLFNSTDGNLRDFGFGLNENEEKQYSVNTSCKMYPEKTNQNHLSNFDHFFTVPVNKSY